MDNAVMVVTKLSDFSIESIVEEIIFSISTVFKNSSKFFKQSPPSSREIITQERKEEMIKSNNGTIELKGTMIEMRADFTCIVKSLKKAMMESGFTEQEAEKEITECVETGFMSEKKFEEKFQQALKGLSKMPLGNILATLILNESFKGNADE